MMPSLQPDSTDTEQILLIKIIKMLSILLQPDPTPNTCGCDSIPTLLKMLLTLLNNRTV